jgi:hypothetical protein
LTSSTYIEIAHYVCLQLGLPRSTVRVLKFDAKKEDVAAVEEIILEDKAAGRLPIMCIANVHSAIFQVKTFQILTTIFVYLLKGNHIKM